MWSVRPLVVFVVGVAACAAWQPRRRGPSAAQLAPLPTIAIDAGPLGPLALEPGLALAPAEVSRSRNALLEGRYLDQARIDADLAVFEAVIATYLPAQPGDLQRHEQARAAVRDLHRLAPYSIASVTSGLRSAAADLDVCVMFAGTVAPCWGERPARPRASAASPFAVGQAGPGIGLLVVRDLRRADDPAWRDFATAAAALATAPGLVIDLREAIGADPRPLLSWVATLAGPGALAPLRAIERPAGADVDVAAYRAHFTDRGRDEAVWRGLVATASADLAVPAPPRPTRPIHVVVGPGCESACELVTRVLEAYAGALVTGGVGRLGRLGRDEPALRIAPHSQAGFYVFATRYLLDQAIEAATGPSDAWHVARAGDPDPRRPDGSDGDEAPADPHLAFAVRDVQQRIATPAGWPRCDQLSSVVPADEGRVRGTNFLAPGVCSDPTRTLVHADVPLSALRRFLSTCTVPVEVYPYGAGVFLVHAPRAPSAGLVAQIGASALIDRVEVECTHERGLDHTTGR